MEKKTLSRILAEYTVDFKLENVPADVVAYAKLHIVDTVGCALAAISEPHAKMMKTALTQMGGRNDATLWGSTQKLSVTDAVIYNGGLIHGLDYDDTHALAITHPSASIIDCAFTVGEVENKSGKDILEAIILGYEILIRLGNVAKGKFHNIGFHPTGLIASFAAACVAGKLQGASVDEIVNAIGLCGSQAAALLEFLHDGTWNKKIHPGWGVHSALYSLAFAKEGFLGAKEIFEGSFGLYQTHLGTTEDIFEAFEDLGKEWVTREIAFKFYPTCHWTHGDLDILLRQMKKESFGQDDIKEIECFIDPRGGGVVAEPKDKKVNPETDYQMRFSLYYAMAVAAVLGKIAPKDINMEMLNNKEIIDMIQRVRITIDPREEVQGHFPGHVKITLNDGRVFDEAQPYEKGSKENPANEEDVLRKFHDNVDDILGEETSEALSSFMFSMEKLNSIMPIIDAMVVKVSR